jgi:hypothetical protein
MWFDESTNAAYEHGIMRAIQEAGYIPRRIDRVETTGKIDDEILSEIRKSRFLVADFTGQRQSVYFEAGFALGLGRTVIWTCQEEEIADLRFDTRQYAHIPWNTPEELRERLRRRIEAVVGPGPHAQGASSS